MLDHHDTSWVVSPLLLVKLTKQAVIRSITAATLEGIVLVIDLGYILQSIDLLLRSEVSSCRDLWDAQDPLQAMLLETVIHLEESFHLS